MRWFVAREAGKRLAKLGGSAAEFDVAPSRRLGNT